MAATTRIGAGTSPLLAAPMSPARVAVALGHWSTRSGPLYLGLADALRRAIRRGDVPPGTCLPAERALAAALAVSRGTVAAAYDLLRTEQVLASRTGSGTWVRPEAARPIALLYDPMPSAPSRRLSGRLVDPVPGLIDLATGSLSGLEGLPPDLFTMPDLRTLERLGGGHGYQPLGLPELRARIAAHHGDRGLPTRPAQVAVTAGAQQAIGLVGQLLVRPGDTVVVETPTYPGALDVFGRLGARVVAVPAATSWARPDVLRRAVEDHAPRLVYVLADCTNPTGQVMPESHRREIARLADEHQVYVLEDNSLADVVLEPRDIAPIAAFSRTGRVLTLGSLSKVAWGGLRVGWLRGPAAFVDPLGRLKAATDFGMPVPPQVTALRVLDDLPAIAAARRDLVRARRDLAERELAGLLPAWRWTSPEGGLSLWIRLPAGTADGLAQVAVRHGVEFTPGSAHAVDGSFDDHLRLSYGPQPAVLQAGIARLAAAWRAYAAGPAVRAAS